MQQAAVLTSRLCATNGFKRRGFVLLSAFATPLRAPSSAEPWGSDNCQWMQTHVPAPATGAT
jgi:hypothetical protein